MSKISNDLLNDTLSLVQLARETALAKGRNTQAERLAPVADNLRGMVATTRQSAQATNAAPSAATGVMGQSDFKTLLSAAQSTSKVKAASTSASLERNQIVNSMSSAGMSELDIARYLGITRDEVRMIVKLNQSGTAGRPAAGLGGVK